MNHTIYVWMGKSHPVLTPIVMNDELTTVDYFLYFIFGLSFLTYLYIFLQMGYPKWLSYLESFLKYSLT